MSDGMLRFLAVATALLTANRGLDIDPGIRASHDDVAAGVLLVVEELENGLHPSQAARVLRLIQETSSELGTQVIFTFRTRLRRLTALPGYPESMASGRLGDLVSRVERETYRERTGITDVRIWTLDASLHAYT
jgi:predicted ATPase